MGSYSFSPRACVVDCDPGIDDALALALLARSPEFDLRLVTAVRGNVAVEVATRNARRVLAACGRPEVPVAAGASRPLVRLAPPRPPVHGVNGLGEVELPAAPAEASLAAGRSASPERGAADDCGLDGPCDATETALDALVRVLEPAAPGEITVVALAPLTNLALLLAARPDLADRIGLLAVMGGTIDRGNVTPFAEFNVWADPEATYRVLDESALPTRLFTLAATRKASLDEPQRRQLAGWSATGATLAEMILGYDDLVTGAGWPLHDAIVVAGLLEPEIVTVREAAAIEVDTSTGPRRGATTVTWDGPRRPLEVAADADPERFRELLRERIGSLA